MGVLLIGVALALLLSARKRAPIERETSKKLGPSSAVEPKQPQPTGALKTQSPPAFNITPQGVIAIVPVAAAALTAVKAVASGITVTGAFLGKLAIAVIVIVWVVLLAVALYVMASFFSVVNYAVGALARSGPLGVFDRLSATIAAHENNLLFDWLPRAGGAVDMTAVKNIPGLQNPQGFGVWPEQLPYPTSVRMDAEKLVVLAVTARVLAIEYARAVNDVMMNWAVEEYGETPQSAWDKGIALPNAEFELLISRYYQFNATTSYGLTLPGTWNEHRSTVLAQLPLRVAQASFLGRVTGIHWLAAKTNARITPIAADAADPTELFYPPVYKRVFGLNWRREGKVYFDDNAKLGMNFADGRIVHPDNIVKAPGAD